MTPLNTWVINKAMCKSNISSKRYIQKVGEELTGNLNGATESLTFENLRDPVQHLLLHEK